MGSAHHCDLRWSFDFSLTGTYNCFVCFALRLGNEACYPHFLLQSRFCSASCHPSQLSSACTVELNVAHPAEGQSLLWNQMHFYWKSCPWCPVPGHPQRKRGIPLQYLSLQGLGLPSTYRSLPQHRFCSMFLNHRKMGVLEMSADSSACHPACGIGKPFLEQPSCELRVALCPCLMDSVIKGGWLLSTLVSHWPWQRNEPQGGHYSFLSLFRALGHKMGAPKVKNVCYQVRKKGHTEMRKLKGLGRQGRRPDGL